jgi:hypothetical protein
MVQTTMQRIFVLGLALSATVALAQNTPDIPPEKIVIVPMGNPEVFDAGVAQPPPPPVPQVQPNDQYIPPGYVPPTPQPQTDAPVQPPPERTIEALPPPTPLPEQLDPNPPQIAPQGPGAMIDGHPREGSFLSGPGSFTFLMHHTLMTSLGALSTQMIPRAIDAAPHFDETRNSAGKLLLPAGGCSVDSAGVPIDQTTFLGEPRYAHSGTTGTTGPTKVQTCAEIFTGEGARLAYLSSTLIGAGVGFTSAAIWQFYNWMSPRSANFGLITSFFGGMFLGGFTDLLTGHKDAYATTWATMIGNSAGAWLATIIGGGDIALNKATLIVSGGAWAAIYAALIVGMIAPGGNVTPRDGLAGIMLMPAIGAGLMALATLKFNPSFGQIMRANLFGGLVGGVVLVLSGLLLGPSTAFTSSPVPYILAGVGAIGAQTLVSLLWADAAEPPPASAGSSSDRKYRNVWW